MVTGGVCLAGLLWLMNAQDVFRLQPLPSSRVVVAQGAYFPRLVEARNGDLLAFFKTGAPHIGKGGRASMARSTDGGRTWSAPATMFDRPDADDGVTATGVLADGTILAAAVSYTWKGERYSMEGWQAGIWLVRSTDHGRSWSTPEPVAVKPFEWAYPFGHILELGHGTLLLTGYAGQLPNSRERDNVVIALRSTDGGRSWSGPDTVARRFNEVSTVLRRDGSVLAVIRAQDGGYLASTVSRDQGRTWSAPQRITANNEHPGDLLRLRDGRLLLSFGERNKPYGVQAMLSSDDGATWDANRVVLAADGDHGDLGYPVTVERADGTLVTVYYIVYGERDPEGVKGIAPKNAFTKAVLWSMSALASFQWTEKRSLPRGISGAAAAPLGGEVVYAGGTTWENGVKLFLDDLQIYTPERDAWRSGPPMPAKVAYPSFVAGPEGLEVFGGTDGSGPLRATWKLDAAKSKWTKAGDAPADTILGQAARIGDEVYLFGGCGDVNDLTKCSNDVWKRDGSGRWAKVAALPVPGLALAALAVAGGKVYLFGGCNMPAAGDLRNRAEAHVFDPANASWRRLRDLPAANRGLTAFALNGQTILLAGGYDTGFSAGVNAYEIATDSYRALPPFPLAGASIDFQRVGNVLYGAGGEDRMRHRSARVFASPIE